MEKNESGKEYENMKIKACPFCGGEAEIQIRLSNICCKHCGATLTINEQEIKKAVAKELGEVWNRRVRDEGRDLVSIEDVLALINDTGGCDATEEYTRGWDAALDELYVRISEMLPIM